MISTVRFFIQKINCYSFVCYSMSREARILHKMMKKGLTKKNAKIQENRIVTKTLLSQPYDNEKCSPRMVALNKIYMEHITEMLNNGECGRQLVDLEVEVTKVRISRSCDFLNIYFISKKFCISSNTIKETLNGALAELQAKMGRLNFIGRVPCLRFIQDARLENSIRMEKIFEIMDLGKNIEPINKRKVFTSDFPEGLDSPPVMRQNVFGLDVAKIKERIAADIVRFKVINSETSESEWNIDNNCPEKLIKFNKKDFYKFYKKRRIEELKRRKMKEREMNASYDSFDYSFDVLKNKYEFIDEEIEDLKDEDVRDEDMCDEDISDENMSDDEMKIQNKFKEI